MRIQLLRTGIFINSRQSTGNLYNVFVSDGLHSKNQNPGMRFLVIDRRLDSNSNNPIEIYPVSYREDNVKTDIEGVFITSNQVHEVNIKWQNEYTRFANQWFKMMAALDYFTEYLTREEEGEDIVCMCGNNSAFDGYLNCDENGQVIDKNRSTQSYSLCVNCKRIYRQDTLEVIGQLFTTPKTKQVKISYDIFKPVNSMSYAEKAKLFHVLSGIIPAFLSFVADRGQKTIQGCIEEFESPFQEGLSEVAWKMLAKNVSQLLSTSMRRFLEESDLFAKELFTGYNKPFLLHCIQQYLADCNNQRVCRGIEFIFDL